MIASSQVVQAVSSATAARGQYDKRFASYRTDPKSISKGKHIQQIEGNADHLCQALLWVEIVHSR